MADPLLTGAVAPPPKPKRKPASTSWAERGLPDDAAAANERLARSRANRQKKEPTVVLQGTRVRKSVSDAIEAIAERYEVPLAQVRKRFFEDGVRTYAPELAEKCGLVKPPNPFDAMAPTNTIPPGPKKTAYYEPETQPAFDPRDDAAAAITGIQLPMGGAPLGDYGAITE